MANAVQRFMLAKRQHWRRGGGVEARHLHSVGSLNTSLPGDLLAMAPQPNEGCVSWLRERGFPAARLAGMRIHHRGARCLRLQPYPPLTWPKQTWAAGTPLDSVPAQGLKTETTIWQGLLIFARTRPWAAVVVHGTQQSARISPA